MQNFFSQRGYLLLLLVATLQVHAQVNQPTTPPSAAKANDANAPLHALAPEYPVTYGPPTAGAIKTVLDRVYRYLDGVTPAQLIDRSTGRPLDDAGRADTGSIFAPGDFRLLSYEWGVVYAGMLQTSAATGDTAYSQYAYKRLQLVADAFPALKT